VRIRIRLGVKREKLRTGGPPGPGLRVRVTAGATASASGNLKPEDSDSDNLNRRDCTGTRTGHHVTVLHCQNFKVCSIRNVTCVQPNHASRCHSLRLRQSP
jgi:hypothetical protein